LRSVRFGNSVYFVNIVTGLSGFARLSSTGFMKSTTAFSLDQLAADGRIAPEVLAILRDRHDYRVGGLPRNTSNGLETAYAAADLRSELIAAEREYIYQLLREGKITDEARRRIERELDLEEASIACKKEGGMEPPL
jgi:CPA1 family monovalent cation:H+ antiporter